MEPMVLVVDDDPDIRESLGLLLEAAGFAVRYAADGKEALVALSTVEDPPAVVFLDLEMPIMSGWELLEVLRSDGRLSCIPVVVVSGQEKERPPGAVRYLTKPPDAEDILAIAAAYCGGPRCACS